MLLHCFYFIQKILFTAFNVLHHVWETYAEIFTDNEIEQDISSYDYYAHSICDLFVIVYALFAVRFKGLRNFLVIVFFFFLCLQYIAAAYFEEASYETLRVMFAELFIFYFCVC